MKIILYIRYTNWLEFWTEQAQFHSATVYVY